MTEAEWDRCTDPREMLKSLRRRGRRRVRKLRRFAVACCRRVSHLLAWDPSGCTIVNIVEGFADGSAGEGEFDAFLESPRRPCKHSQDDVKSAAETIASTAAAFFAGCTAYSLSDRRVVTKPAEVLDAAANTAQYAARAVAVEKGGWDEAAQGQAERAEWEWQCRLLRDLFGPLPFREVAIDPAWLAWNDGTVRRIAEGIYQERDFGRISILADALEDAGCDSEDILSHCRQQGAVHVRGCWVIDRLLGKD